MLLTGCALGQHSMKPPRSKAQRSLSLSQIDQIWLRLRRPFLFPQAGHECRWERYDAHCAGCVLCGKLHRCPDGMAGCTCPLAETDDGGHVCLITGLCIPEIRTATEEFVEHALFDSKQSLASGDEDLHDRVLCVVSTFILSPSSIMCRELERKKYSQKLRQAFWRVLRQCKKDDPYALPDICHVVARVIQQEPPPPSLVASTAGLYHQDIRGVALECAVSITGAIRQIYGMGYRKLCQGVKFTNIVIGMLYMTRTGLNISHVFNLSAVPRVCGLLPAETYLNYLGVSNKVICDTENEIKSCIRSFAEPRATASVPCNVRAACASSALSRPLTQSS